MNFARRVVVNPANKKQWYILWSTGRIDPGGSQPPPPVKQSALGTSHTFGEGGGRAAGTAPISEGNDVIVGLVITNWSTPSGYTFSRYGQVFEFGDATPTPENTQPVFFTFAYDGFIDFVMNPAANGQGYGLDIYGNLYDIGSSPVVESGGFNEGVARRLYMDWATKKYIILDWKGRRHSRAGALQITARKDFGGTTGIQTYSSGAATTNLLEQCVGAAFYNEFDAGEGDGWMLHGYGQIYSLNDGQLVYGEPLHDNWGYASDIAILDDGLSATPLRLLVLTIYGTTQEVLVSTPPLVTPGTNPANPTTDTTRPVFNFVYSDNEGDAVTDWDFVVLNAAQYGSSGTNEVQRITVTGTPTGGGYWLSFGAESVFVPYNTTGAALLTQLEGMNAFESGDLAVSGGPHPGTAIDITFQGRYAKWDWPAFKVTKSFTGGSSPAVAVTTPTPGVGIDPLSIVSPIFSEHVSLPEARFISSRRIETDLPNTTYRAYARATDTSGLTSPWSMRQWVQNATAPTTPRLEAFDLGPKAGVQLDIRALLTIDAKYYLEYQDADESEWHYVEAGAGAPSTSLAEIFEWHFDTPGNVEDWQPQPGVYGLVQSTDRSFAGAGSLKVTAQASTANLFPFSAYGSTGTEGVPIAPATPGVSHDLATRIWTSTSGRQAQLVAVWLDATRNEVGPRSTSAPVALTQNAWTALTFSSAAAPSSARYICVQVIYTLVSAANVPNGEVFYIDEFSESSMANEATLYDRQPRAGVQRKYRVRQLREEPWLAGAYSPIVNVTQTSKIWTLRDAQDPAALAIEVKMQDDLELQEEVIRGKFNPDGRTDTVVITAKNAVKDPSFDLNVWALNKSDHDKIRALYRGENIMLLRDYFGNAYFITATDSVRRKFLRAGPEPTETTPLRHAHEISIPVHTVVRPLEGPASGSLALID